MVSNHFSNCMCGGPPTWSDFCPAQWAPPRDSHHHDAVMLSGAFGHCRPLQNQCQGSIAVVTLLMTLAVTCKGCTCVVTPDLYAIRIAERHRLYGCRYRRALASLHLICMWSHLLNGTACTVAGTTVHSRPWRHGFQSAKFRATSTCHSYGAYVTCCCSVAVPQPGW